MEVARPLRRRGIHRVWLSARGELLMRDRTVAPGLYARATWEVFAPVHDGGPYESKSGVGVGVAHGSLGLGLFIEAGPQRTEDGRTTFAATTGLSLRLPFLAALGFDLRGCY